MPEKVNSCRDGQINSKGVINETNAYIFIFLEFYEPASRQSPAPQTVRQREEVGPDL